MKLSEARGVLVAVGGAEDRSPESPILKEFVRLAGGKRANIVVMTVATDSPEETGAEYIEVFQKIGVRQVQMLDVSSRSDATAEENLEIVRNADGLYFTGGDQLHITSMMGGTELQKIIHERYEKGMIIGGTSAGAAMMSNSMILGGNGEEAPKLGGVEIGPGMDLVLGCMIDTHFSQRGRHGRLLTAVAHYPQDLGVGIDENTAMVIEKNEVRVMGEGAVTIIDAGAMTYANTPNIEKGQNLALADVRIHVLCEGEKFNLPERKVIIPKEAQHKVKRAGSNENVKQIKK
ncbi:MAG: cyanophycinase [Acidobacteriota bacterium]|nr:cyanophycinase [Acidobacteriota bacterium]